MEETTGAVSSVKVLTGEEILMIVRTVISRAYKSETEGFKDKSYQIYAYGPNAFAVHQDSKFHKDFADGNIKTVMLTVTEDGWSLANHVTWAQAIGVKRNQLMFDAITVKDVKVDMAALTSAV